MMPFVELNFPGAPVIIERFPRCLNRKSLAPIRSSPSHKGRLPEDTALPRSLHKNSNVKKQEGNRLAAPKTRTA